MTRHLVEVAAATGRPLDEVLTWDADTLATFMEVLAHGSRR